MKTARSARCSGARLSGLAPGPRRTIPGHGTARARSPQVSALLFQGGRHAARPTAEATRDLGGCTQAGHTVTIRMTLVDSVRKRGASVP